MGLGYERLARSTLPPSLSERDRVDLPGRADREGGLTEHHGGAGGQSHSKSRLDLLECGVESSYDDERSRTGCE